MTPIVHVPSEWVLAYWLGIGVVIYLANKNVRMFAFAGVFVYFLGLTIGLRVFYS